VFGTLHRTPARSNRMEGGMTKRVFVKWLHWTAFVLMGYFLFVEPEVSESASAAAKSDGLSTHAGMGMLLAIVAITWFVIYFRDGALGRPGPKLAPWAKTAHRVLNIGLYWAVPLTVFTGGLAGLASAYPVMGFGVIPLNPAGWGTGGLHDIAQEVHEIAFDITIILIFVHGGFHIWRHYGVKDNALRIMAPKALHKYL
jgi:cytochrome b561